MTAASGVAGRRRRGRELALRVLFELEGTQKSPEWAVRYQAEDMRAPADVSSFAQDIVTGCVRHAQRIDDTIARASENWALADLGKVERALLRLTTYELLYARDVPAAVAIDEAVELAKSYAGEEAAQFVNGVLGAVARGLA